MKNAITTVTFMKHTNAVLTKLFLSLLLLSATLFSCSKKDSTNEVNASALTGIWQFAGGKEYFQPNGGSKTLTDIDPADASVTVQFKSDGTFSFSGADGPETGTYKLTGNSLYIKYNNADWGESTATVLTLTNTSLIIEVNESGTNDNGVAGTFYYEQSYTKK